jgi:hypothetical protein
MTAPKLLSRRSIATLALVACAGLGGPAAAGAATELSWTNAKPERLAGTAPGGDAYTSDRIVWLECRGRATAVMTGWSGPKAPVAIIYSHLTQTERTMGLAVRRPVAGGTFRARALCLSGAKVTTREQSSGTVSCAAKQIAIGVPIDSGPYWQEPVSSKPVGARGWVTEGQGTYGRSKVICVPAKALRRVQRVRAAATFRAGSTTAVVTGSCKDGRRPIGWGFEAGTLPDNPWRSSVSAVGMTTPFIAASLPRGKAGWQLTFATPDGAPARTSTPLAVHLTCAVPA